jgi:hypothetical protein
MVLKLMTLTYCATDLKVDLKFDTPTTHAHPPSKTQSSIIGSLFVLNVIGIFDLPQIREWLKLRVCVCVCKMVSMNVWQWNRLRPDLWVWVHYHAQKAPPTTHKHTHFYTHLLTHTHTVNLFGQIIKYTYRHKFLFFSFSLFYVFV